MSIRDFLLSIQQKSQAFLEFEEAEFEFHFLAECLPEENYFGIAVECV